MVTTLMALAKMATLGPLKIKVYWDEGFHVITFVHDVTNKIFLRDPNYIADVVIWSKFW